jgi:two-component system, OmpR family, phosphate regulon sensor histidine kinase PhoR
MKQADNNSSEIPNSHSEDHFRMTDLNFDDLTLKDAKQIFTELQQHQIELQKQNEEFRKKNIEFETAREKYISLINNAPLGFVTLNAEAIIIDINSTAADYFNEDLSLLINKTITSFILDEDQGIFHLNLKLVFETEEHQQFDLRIIRRNNEIYWSQIKLVIIKNNDGSKYCSAIINVDNERKRTETALKESILQWQQIFDGIGDSICLFDKDGKILVANKKTRELLKKTESEFIGENCYKVIHDLTGPFDECPFQRAKISKKRETFTMQFDDKWIEVIVDPLLNDKGNMIGAVHIMSDVTERLRVGEALKESEEKFKTIFEEALDGILIADIETKKIISGNKMICKMLGYDISEITQVVIDDIFIKTLMVDFLNERDKHKNNDIRKLTNIEVKRKDLSTFYADINSSFVKIKGKRYLLSIFRDISHHKEIETELKDAKERFELIFQTSPDAILITRINDGYYIDSNETFTKYTGYTREDLKGKSTLDINIWANPADREKLMQIIQEKGNCQNLEILVRNKNGTFKTIIMSAEIIPLQGTPHLLSISRDITEIKEIEKLYKQSEKKYRLIAENANDVILVLHVPSRKITYISPSVELLMGYTANDFLHMSLKDILSPESLKHLLTDLAKRIVNIKGGDYSAKSKIYELQIICKDKSLIWTELSTTFNISDQGEIEELIGVNRNINERKLIQEKIEQNELRLASLLKISQNTFDTNEDLLNFSLEEAIKLTASKIGFFYFYNEENKEFTLLAWSKDTTKDCKISDFEPISKLEKTGLWGEAVRQRKPIIVNNFNEPNPLKKGYPKGHSHLDKFLSIPIIIEDKIEAVIGVANKVADYSEADVIHLSLLMDGVWKVLHRTELEKILKQKNEELHNLVATKDRFFSIVAHDLKNPFNVIIGFSELMMNGNGEGSLENLKKYASYIHTSSKQAYNLLINLLEWSSSQRGIMQFNPEKIEVEPFIKETIKVLQSNTDDKKIKITENIQPGLKVYADKNMLGIILRNLISNAIKYTHIKGNIQINVNESDNEFKFSITDNGTGIHKEDLEKLFKNEIQHTTTGTNNEKGTGLGLLLCKDFVDRHHGQIWAESQFGKGSTFHFTLPKKPETKEKTKKVQE